FALPARAAATVRQRAGCGTARAGSRYPPLRRGAARCCAGAGRPVPPGPGRLEKPAALAARNQLNAGNAPSNAIQKFNASSGWQFSCGWPPPAMSTTVGEKVVFAVAFGTKGEVFAGPVRP